MTNHTDLDPIYALHGWSLNSGVFDAQKLAQVTSRKVIVADLPGHGNRANENLGTDAQEIAAQLLSKAPKRAVWLGWSLGGMLTLAAVQNAPQRISSMILVSTSLSFIKRDNQQYGIPEKQILKMKQDLSSNPSKTVSNFLSSIVVPNVDGRKALRVMRGAQKKRGSANLKALEDGLTLLQTMDFRKKVKQISLPTLVVGGAKDWLVQPEALKALSSNLKNAKLAILPNAGHACFLSHENEFNNQVAQFLSAV